VRQKLTHKERDNETGLDYFLARYYSSTQGRFTSPDEFTGGPDELFDFADDASDNPTFYADLENPQSLNKYQYTYNNPLNLTDDDGHCPICVVVVVVAVEILLAPDTVSAPTGHPGEVIPRSGDGVQTLLANATVGAIGGLIVSKAGRGVLKYAFGREATEVVEEVAAKGGRTEAKIPSEQRVKPPTKNQRQAVYAANRAKNSPKEHSDSGK
jgi:RHS repeat-associated protein